jgi:hypothetical protein
MLLFCGYNSLHVNALVAEAFGLLRRDGHDCMAVQWTSEGAAELRQCGIQCYYTPSHRDPPGGVKDEIDRYCRIWEESGELPFFHDIDVKELLFGYRNLEQLFGPEFPAKCLRVVLNSVASAEMIFELVKPECVLLWNGTVGDSAAYKAVAKKHESRILYLERGLLPNTIQLDTQGVNGASSASRMGHMPCESSNSWDWARSIIGRYRSSDHSGLPQPGSLPEKDLLAMHDIPENKKVVLFPCQVAYDSNICIYSPFRLYPEVYDWLASGYGGRDDVIVVAKKHPLGQIDESYVKKCLGAGGRFVTTGNIRQWIQLSHHVVSINSTAAFEAVLLGKPVILMGKALFGGPGTAGKGLTFDVSSPEELCRTAHGLISGVLRDSGDPHARVTSLVAYLHRHYMIFEQGIPGEAGRLAGYLSSFLSSKTGRCNSDALVAHLDDYARALDRLTEGSYQLRLNKQQLEARISHLEGELAWTKEQLRTFQLQKMEELAARVELDKPIIIYGAGEAGRRMARIIRGRGGRIHCFVDGDTALCGNAAEGIRIVPLREIGLHEPVRFVISSLAHKTEIESNIAAHFQGSNFPPDIFEANGNVNKGTS